MGKLDTDIFAEIKEIKYKSFFNLNLQEIKIRDFDINECPSSCVINTGKDKFALSKWVSPKRTRSYPFERVYNTLGYSKKITVIPIIKDEGKEGDRDFIQWDTVSLMSLLDVYVILGYYDSATKSPKRAHKITNQKFNNIFIKNKIDEISQYHSSALHWNLNQIKSNLSTIVKRVFNSYNAISKTTKVDMHNKKGIDNFVRSISLDIEQFKNESRRKAKEAQHREMKTIQPKELLTSITKSKITIKNFLGGYYYFTTDEVNIKKNKLFLIESKHSKNALLPNISDIKDGLLKMILYKNLSSVKINNKEYQKIPLLRLTSNKLKSNIVSGDKNEVIDLFIKKNKFNEKNADVIKTLFKEAQHNNFFIEIRKI
ncbi:MAG TPA: hypothetical protein PK447_05770 [Ignavibacteria bacterium]|nr:hypothetical protein [Ignavibacteria bacterium]